MEVDLEKKIKDFLKNFKNHTLQLRIFIQNQCGNEINVQFYYSGISSSNLLDPQQTFRLTDQIIPPYETSPKIRKIKIKITTFLKEI